MTGLYYIFQKMFGTYFPKTSSICMVRFSILFSIHVDINEKEKKIFFHNAIQIS